MKGILPAAANPAASLARFCSATPTSTYRSGNSFSNHSARVDSLRSAQRTTMFLSVFPASTTPCPNPSRVGFRSTSALNNSGSRCASIRIMSGIFARDPSAAGPDPFQESRRLLFAGRFTVPVVVELYFRHAFPRNRMGDDDGRLFIDRFCLLDRGNDCGNIVPVYLKDVPVERFVLPAKRFQWHDVLRHPVYLDVIAVNDGSQVMKFILSREHRAFPRIARILFSIAHEAVHAFPATVHPERVCESRGPWGGASPPHRGGLG